MQLRQAGITQFAGIAFRESLDAQDYTFWINSGGSWTSERAPGGDQPATTLIPITIDPAIHTGLGSTNTLEVRFRGAHFDFFVNDVKVGEVTDSHYAAGRYGFVADAGAEAIFSNLTLTVY
jgi:hypothetical protein